MGCPNAGAGVRIVGKKTLEQPNFDPINTVITTSVVTESMPLVTPILVRYPFRKKKLKSYKT